MPALPMSAPNYPDTMTTDAMTPATRQQKRIRRREFWSLTLLIALSAWISDLLPWSGWQLTALIGLIVVVCTIYGWAKRRRREAAERREAEAAAGR